MESSFLTARDFEAVGSEIGDGDALAVAFLESRASCAVYARLVVVVIHR